MTNVGYRVLFCGRIVSHSFWIRRKCECSSSPESKPGLGFRLRVFGLGFSTKGNPKVGDPSRLRVGLKLGVGGNNGLVDNNKSIVVTNLRTRAESQRIVAARPLCRLQYPVLAKSSAMDLPQ